MTERSRPPYVFPDRRPGEYDTDRRGTLWRVLGPMYTDGTGWNWEKCSKIALVSGDIWVPIHMLHSKQIPAIEERSRELKKAKP